MTELSRDKQIGGDHYVKHKIQPWDIIEEYNLGFWDGNAVKYILRYKKKGNPLEDIEKAIHYLEHVKELLLKHADEIVKQAENVIPPTGKEA